MAVRIFSHFVFLRAPLPSAISLPSGNTVIRRLIIRRNKRIREANCSGSNLTISSNWTYHIFHLSFKGTVDGI